VHTNGVWTFFNVRLCADSGPHTTLNRLVVLANGVWTFANGSLVQLSDQPPAAGLTNLLRVPDFDETPERIRLLGRDGGLETRLLQDFDRLIIEIFPAAVGIAEVRNGTL